MAKQLSTSSRNNCIATAVNFACPPPSLCACSLLQVGYDMGLPAERLLTRHRAKAQAASKGGAGAAGGVDVGTRQQIISRVKGQGRSGRG